jgi:hypothetical protein
VALCQHHDAITGTAKQHVVDDYHARLASGLCEAQQVVTNALAHLIQGKSLPAHLRGAAATAQKSSAPRVVLGRAGGATEPEAAASRRLQEAQASLSLRATLRQLLLKHWKHDARQQRGDSPAVRAMRHRAASLILPP